jgi:hypothetical protein
MLISQPTVIIKVICEYLQSKEIVKLRLLSKKFNNIDEFLSKIQSEYKEVMFAEYECKCANKKLYLKKYKYQKTCLQKLKEVLKIHLDDTRDYDVKYDTTALLLTIGIFKHKYVFNDNNQLKIEKIIKKVFINYNVSYYRVNPRYIRIDDRWRDNNEFELIYTVSKN